MAKNKNKDIILSELTDYELEQVHFKLQSQKVDAENKYKNKITNIDNSIYACEEERRYREIPYIKTKIGFKTGNNG